MSPEHNAAREGTRSRAIRTVFLCGQLPEPFAPAVTAPTIQPTNRPYADAWAAVPKALRRVGFETIKAVRKAASAAPKINAAQPKTKPPTPPVTALLTQARMTATNTIKRIALRSSASSWRMAPLESLAGPNAQRGHVSTRKNQSQALPVPEEVCLSTHSVNGWLPNAKTRTAVAKVPAPATVRVFAMSTKYSR